MIKEPSSGRFRGLNVAAIRESSRGSAIKLNCRKYVVIRCLSDGIVGSDVVESVNFKNNFLSNKHLKNLQSR